MPYVKFFIPIIIRDEYWRLFDLWPHEGNSERRCREYLEPWNDIMGRAIYWTKTCDVDSILTIFHRKTLVASMNKGFGMSVYALCVSKFYFQHFLGEMSNAWFCIYTLQISIHSSSFLHISRYKIRKQPKVFKPKAKWV